MTDATLKIPGPVTKLTADNVFADLEEHWHEAKASYDMDPATVVEQNFIDMGIEPRAASAELIEEGYVPHRLQKLVHDSMMDYRFTVLVCHRRWGKTVCAVNALCDAAVRHQGYLGKPGRFVYVAPMLKQAKAVAWMYLKAFAARVEGARKHEGELYVEFPNGARITLYGVEDGGEAMRGLFLDGAVLDEPADMRGSVWSSVLVYALADHDGWALFIGTPKGINMFSARYDHAVKDDDWLAFKFPCTETDLPWLPQEKLEKLEADSSESEWRQEMLCDFGASSGNVIITLDTVTESMSRVTKSEAYLTGFEKVVGIDPAWMGDDLTAICFRWGLEVYPIKTFARGKNSHETLDLICGHLMQLKKQFEPDAWFMDQSYGEGIFSKMKTYGVDINLIAFGGKAVDETQFGNRVTEMYFTANAWLEVGGHLPDEEDLKAELTSVTYQMKKINGFDVRVRDPKKEIRKLIDRSPDKADSFVLTHAQPVVPGDTRLDFQPKVKVSSGGYHPHDKLRKRNKKTKAASSRRTGRR